MENTLLTVGIVCILAAIVGGGLKAFGVEIPVLSTLVRQLVLGAFGIVLLIVAFQIRPKPAPAPTPPKPQQAQAIVRFAQRGGPFVMLGDRGTAPRPGNWWNTMDISFQNDCREPVYVQPGDFRLYVSPNVTTDDAQNFYPTIESYPGKLIPTWVKPGTTLEGRIVFEVPETLENGIQSNGSFKIVRLFTQSSCPVVYDPY